MLVSKSCFSKAWELNWYPLWSIFHLDNRMNLKNNLTCRQKNAKTEFSSLASCNNMQTNLWQQQHKSKARLSRTCEDSVHSRRCKRVQDLSQRFAKYFWIRPWLAEYVWIMDGPWFVKYIHYTYRPDPAFPDIYAANPYLQHIWLAWNIFGWRPWWAEHESMMETMMDEQKPRTGLRLSVSKADETPRGTDDYISSLNSIRPNSLVRDEDEDEEEKGEVDDWLHSNCRNSIDPKSVVQSNLIAYDELWLCYVICVL